MYSIGFLLGTGLLKKENKVKEKKLIKKIKSPRRSRKDLSVECFLRKVLGNGLIQADKKM